MKKVHFIFVLYKTAKSEVKRLKKEIKQLGFKNYSVSFIDNNKNNPGYAAGINLGLKEGLVKKPDFFVIANPDISFLDLRADDFIQVLKKFDLAGFSFKQNEKLYYGGKIDKWRLSGGLIETRPKKRFFPVDFISGSLMIIKRSVIKKVGFFDESYFMYYEDVDYCYQAKKLGFLIGIDSKKKYHHFEISKDNLKKEYFLIKNRWRFFWRYANWLQKIRELIRLPKTFIETTPFFLRIIFQSFFLKDFFSLNFANFLNRIFHFGLFLFLIRILEPKEYGLYTLVWAYIGFFNPFMDLGTTNYGLVYSPREDKKRLNQLISFRFFIGLVIIFLVNLSALIFFRNNFKQFLYISLCSMVVLSNVWSGSYLIINSLKQKVVNSSILSFIFNLFFVSLIIIFYFLFKSLTAIFLAVFISYFLYFIFSYLLVKKEIGDYYFSLNFNWWKKIVFRSLVFLLIGFFANLRFRVDVFLLDYFQSTKAVGLFSSAYKFFDAAVMIAGSYNIVAMPIYSRMAKDWNQLKRKIKKDLIFLWIIGFVIAFGFYFFGPLFLNLLMTKKYIDSVLLARVLILDLPIILLLSVVYNLFYAFKKANYVLNIFIFRSLLTIILNIILIPKYSYWSSVMVIIFSDCLTLLLLSYLFLRLKKTNDNRV